jgi:CheY-like chemotaxis protein
MTPRILIVEDEPDNQFILRLTFEPKYEVFTAADLATAEALYERERPIDLVILDHLLPDGWGLDFCRTLKARPDAPPILIVTAMTQALDELRASAARLSASNASGRRSPVARSAVRRSRRARIWRAGGGATRSCSSIGGRSRIG